MNVDSRTGHGLDRQQVLRMLTSTIFDCAIYRGYGDRIARRDHSEGGFSMANGLKDARLIRDAAAATRTAMPLGAHLAASFEIAAMDPNISHLDWSALALHVAGFERTRRPRQRRRGRAGTATLRAARVAAIAWCRARHRRGPLEVRAFAAVSIPRRVGRRRVAGRRALAARTRRRPGPGPAGYPNDGPPARAADEYKQTPPTNRRTTPVTRSRWSPRLFAARPSVRQKLKKLPRSANGCLGRVTTITAQGTPVSARHRPSAMASSNSPGAHLQGLKKNLKSSGRLMPALTRFAASARRPPGTIDPPSRRAPATSSHAWIIVALSPPYSPPMKSRFSASSLSSSKPFAASPIVSSVGESSDTPSDPRSVCSTTKTAACRRKWLYSLRGASTTCPAAARCTGATLLMSVLFSACTMRGRRRDRMRRRIDGARAR